MAEIIAENSYLVSSNVSKNYCDEDKMIIVLTNL